MKHFKFIVSLTLSLTLGACTKSYQLDSNVKLATMDNLSVAGVATMTFDNPYTCEGNRWLIKPLTKKPFQINANQLMTFLYFRYDSPCKYIISFVPKAGKHYEGQILQVGNQCGFELYEMTVSGNGKKIHRKPATFKTRKFQTIGGVIANATYRCTDKIANSK